MAARRYNGLSGWQPEDDYVEETADAGTKDEDKYGNK